MRDANEINAEYAKLAGLLGEATYRESVAAQARAFYLTKIAALEQEMTQLRKASETIETTETTTAATKPQDKE